MMMIASSLGHGIVPCQIMYLCLKEVICVNLRFSYTIDMISILKAMIQFLSIWLNLIQYDL